LRERDGYSENTGGENSGDRYTEEKEMKGLKTKKRTNNDAGKIYVNRKSV
jgi:hypothetical protein